MKKHWLDKPILRDLFWFIVLPHRLRMFLAEQKPLPHNASCAPDGV
jgi:hypothetical protein